MDLPKVEGTQIRGKVYHLNLRIKPEIQDLYGGKSHLRGSLRTSDPKVATREVRKHKADLLAKEQERARQAEVEDIVSQLSPEQRKAYDAAGGLEGLLEDSERSHAGVEPVGAEVQDDGDEDAGWEPAPEAADDPVPDAAQETEVAPSSTAVVTIEDERGTLAFEVVDP